MRIYPWKVHLIEEGFLVFTNREVVDNRNLFVVAMDRNFTKNPTNLSVPESQPGVLQCNIHSVPPPEIQWEFNNQPLPQHTRYTLR